MLQTVKFVQCTWQPKAITTVPNLYNVEVVGPLYAFTQNVCWETASIGCIQKASNGKFCYYPIIPGTDASCSAKSPRFSDVMAAHLAQGHSIAYYGPDNVFVGNVSWPIPADAGIVYLCASGSIAGAYQTFCSTASADNVIVYVGFTACMVGLPMSHVDDGCYDPSLAVVNVTATPSVVNGITQAPSATAHGPFMTVTVTAHSSSHTTSSPGAIVIVAILVFAYHVPMM